MMSPSNLEPIQEHYRKPRNPDMNFQDQSMYK